MPKVIIKEDACKSCGLCESACPKKIISLQDSRLNAKGFHPAYVTDETKCIGCAFCAMMCPETIIAIQRI